MNDTPRQAVPLPDDARILAEEAFAKVYNDPVTLAACLRAALEAAAPILRADERRNIVKWLHAQSVELAEDKPGLTDRQRYIRAENSQALITAIAHMAAHGMDGN